MNDFTNSYPLLDRQKLQELQRAFMLPRQGIAFGEPDNSSGACSRYAIDASSFGAAAPYFDAARATLAHCVVAISLITSVEAAHSTSTHGLPYPVSSVRRRQGDFVAAVEERKPETSVEFMWNRSTYRARKSAKEYSS